MGSGENADAPPALLSPAYRAVPAWGWVAAIRAPAAVGEIGGAGEEAEAACDGRFQEEKEASLSAARAAGGAFGKEAVASGKAPPPSADAKPPPDMAAPRPPAKNSFSLEALPAGNGCVGCTDICCCS